MDIECPQCKTGNSGTAKFCAECGTPLPAPGEVEFTETIDQPPKELTRGSSFAGRYEVIEELGKGGMGRVYRVEDKKINQEIALKLIKPGIAADPKTIARFRNELKTARTVRHKNICGMYDLGEDEGTHFITMEYVKGEDLKTVIRKMGRLSAGQVVNIAKQVCEGLAEAHGQGIVHRDLKPQNIMIDTDGNVRIMDFGIARSLKEKGITGMGVMIGTPEYMSPEQVDGHAVDQRSDIYSLGIVMYEMVTGRVPFEADTPFAVGYKHKNEPPQDPREIDDQIPEELSRIILKCLEKDKERRYQSASELQKELSKIEQGIPTTDRAVPVRKTTSSREITVKLTPRRMLIPALSVIAIIAAVLIFWPGKSSDLNPKRVAVAAFENRTGDPALDSIGKMAAERIQQGLENIQQFEVAPLSEMSDNSSGDERLRSLAEATKAGIIVHGTFYREGDKIRYHAAIQDIADGKNIVTLDPESGPLDDPGGALEPLRLKIMGGLASHFEPLMEMFLSWLKEPPSFDAFPDFIQGMQAFWRGEYEKSIEYCLRAFEIDPNLKVALISTQVAYTNLGRYEEASEVFKKLEGMKHDFSTGERLMHDFNQSILNGDNEAHLRITRKLADLYPNPQYGYGIALGAIRVNRPREAVDRLADYDPYDPVTQDWSRNYWSVLTAAHHMLGEHKKELKEARKGRKQFPDMMRMLVYEVRALAALGRMADLEKVFARSKALPVQGSYSPGYIMLTAGRELREHGFREESIRVLNEALEWFEDRTEQEKQTAQHRYSKARVFYVSNKFDRARNLFSTLHNDFPENVHYFGYLGASEARLGNRERAMEIHTKLGEDSRPFLFGSPDYWRARIDAVIGNADAAISNLRLAIKKGYHYLNLSPCEDFESLTDYPAYIQIMKPKG